MSYAYYRNVTFQPPGESLTNFPVLVRILNDTEMTARISSSSGYDVGFTTTEGTALAFELDYYDAITGSGAWWVQIPSLLSSSPTTIKMMYGDASIMTDQSAPTTVWSDYQYVLHMAESSTTHAKNSVTGTYLSWVNSQYLTQVDFSAEHSVTGRAVALTLQNPATTTYANVAHLLFATTDSTRKLQAVMIGGCASYPPNDYALGCLSYIGDGLNWGASIASLWLTAPSSGDVLCRYRSIVGNGNTSCGRIDSASTFLSTAAQFNSPISVLGMFSESSSWTGVVHVDEIRFRLSPVSTNWLAYEYNSTINHNTYATYGSECNSDGTVVFKASDYSYYRDITLQQPSETLTNFPVLVRILNNPRMAARIVSSSGYDVVFTSLDKELLNFELDYYDPATGSGAWWVKIPELSSTSPTIIRMWYGNSDITTDQSSAAADVWTEDVYYEIIHHRSNPPKCVFSRFTVSEVVGASQTSTSTIGRELTYTTGYLAGSFATYPSHNYGSYSWAMGIMSIARVVSVSSTAWLAYKPLYNELSSSTQKFGTNRGAPYYSRPQSTNWLAYGMTQYYQGSGLAMVNLVVDGAQAFVGTNGSNLANEITSSCIIPYAAGGACISAAETRYYIAYVPTAWMRYEQVQILNHDNYTAYGDEYNSDGTLVPTFTFHPWLYIPQKVIA